MFSDHNRTIEEILTAARLIGEAECQQIREHSAQSGGSFAASAVATGLTPRVELLAAVARHLGFAFEDVPAPILPEVISRLPTALARRYGVIPLRTEADGLVVAAVDPFDRTMLDELSFVLNGPVQLVVADPEAVEASLDLFYPQESIALPAESGPGVARGRDEQDADVSLHVHDDDGSSVGRLVDLILSQAVRDQASDIHFEPYEDTYRVRYRIDGTLHEMAPPARSLAVPIASRLKVLAELNIAEHRLPQDGRIQLAVAGRAVDLRMSTLPTQFGESIVLRVLDKSVADLELDRLNIPDDVLAAIRKVARLPHGIFVVTGPTGSGKTTTLYSALREINTEDAKILTAEDPVEYQIPGLIQTAINPAVGLTFASALRAFLRQDPDKILVGEIRDLETARTAVQASLTGHLVFSTLHTNDAVGAVTRLADMGLQPYLVASALSAVLAQRLVRRVCPHCRVFDTPGPAVLQSLGTELDGKKLTRIARGPGCSVCHGSGYSGRRGLFEMLTFSDRFREAVSAGAHAQALRSIAIESGMRPLREDAFRLLRGGETTVEEVLRYT